MNIQLIQGEFSAADSLELLTQMIKIKIKYHENKIANHMSEEDIKARESKIKRLQQELFEFNQGVHQGVKSFKIEGIIKVD